MSTHRSIHNQIVVSQEDVQISGLGGTPQQSACINRISRLLSGCLCDAWPEHFTFRHWILFYFERKVCRCLSVFRCLPYENITQANNYHQCQFYVCAVNRREFNFINYSAHWQYSVKKCLQLTSIKSRGSLMVQTTAPRDVVGPNLGTHLVTSEYMYMQTLNRNLPLAVRWRKSTWWNLQSACAQQGRL